jgi:hypothetical protein
MQRKTSRYRNLYALNVILHSLRKHRLPQHLVYRRRTTSRTTKPS